MNHLVESLVTVLLAIVGVAILATIFSPNAQTSNVVNAFGSFFSGAIKAATGPVSGGFGLGGTSTPFMNTGFGGNGFQFGG